MAKRTHVFTCGRGAKINYFCVGEGKTIVFLHGWGGSIASFMGAINALSHRYRCIAVDFAGFGDSPEPKYPYRLNDFTNDLDTLLDELRVKECFFVAHSFGGRVALDYITSNRSANVHGVVLADSAGMKPRRGVNYYINVAKYKMRKKLGLDISSFGSTDYKELSSTMKGTFVNIVNEYLDTKINNIHIPMLIVWGENDMDTPLYMARRLHKKITSSSLVLFKGRGHFAYLEEHSRFVRIVDSFVGGID